MYYFVHYWGINQRFYDYKSAVAFRDQLAKKYDCDISNIEIYAEYYDGELYTGCLH